MKLNLNLFNLPQALVYGLVITSLFVFTGCEENETDGVSCNTPDEAGELVSQTFLQTFSPAQVEPLLALYGAPVGLTLSHTADAYKIEYMTRDKNDELTLASGIMFVPQNASDIDVVSIQHGTVLKRDNVGSSNALYAIDAMLFAMNGYMTVAADYIGLGVSTDMHPYLHAELSTNAVVDMLRAARIYGCENDLDISDNLFLAGYSEGGYATMASHKLMEEQYADEFQLAGVAPMSGPYDLLGSMRNYLMKESFETPAFLAYVAASYDDIYGWGLLGDMFNEPYATQLPSLFDGTQSLGDVNAQLPQTISELFRADFLTSFFAGEEAEIQGAIEENTLLGWGPIAPVRLYHGMADSTVSINNTYNAYNSLRASGGTSVDIVPLPGADHSGGFFISMVLAEAWFDSLSAVVQ